MEIPVGEPTRRARLLPVPGTAIVGRDAEVAGIHGALTAPDARMVTLTGPPGVGKTRLALAAAATAPGSGEVAFVDLTEIRDPGLVLAEVARVLGVGAASREVLPERLVAALATRDLLLVVDNCEHVLDAGPDLAAPLAACPGLRILATSREGLHVAAEREFPVRPLALPAGGEPLDLERFAVISSVAMLVDRVRGFQPEFAVTAANAGALAEICVRLDGLPLALELAAARLKLFTPGELGFRLRHRMGVLTRAARDVPERHRTLRAALAWSHDLLGQDERAVFRRLSVFLGGATLEAAEAVCAGPAAGRPVDVVETLASLLDKSLVQRRTRTDDVAEFVLLESLREFAGEQLDEHGELSATRARHAAHYTEVARRVESLIGTAAESESVDGVGAEVGNLRAALAHCTETGQVASALYLASALGWFAYTRGQFGDGWTTLDRAIGAAAAPGPPPGDDVLGGALLMAGVLAFARADTERAEALFTSALEINDRVPCPRRAAIGSAFRGHLARVRGDFPAAAALHRRAGELHEANGATAGVLWAHYDLGLLARRQGDLDAATASLQEGLRRSRELGYGWAISYCAWALATVLLRRGDPAGAAALLPEALDRCASRDDGRGIAQCLEAGAAAVGGHGHADAAARLLGAAQRLREVLAAPIPLEEHGDLHAVTQAVRRQLGPAAAEQARQAGRLLPRAGAVALAHRALDASGSEPAAVEPEPENPLTPRERQVACLVATGSTNRQIGRALGISEKTAEVHVHNTIRKLGARSRAEVAAWVGSRGLLPQAP